MNEVKQTGNPFAVFRIARTKDIRKIGFGEDDYFETYSFFRNVRKLGLKVGVVKKEFLSCLHWREVNKGYARGFTTYRTYRPKRQEQLFGENKEEREKKMHIPDLDLLFNLELTKPKILDKTEEPVDIILLTYQRRIYLREIIDQFIRNTTYPYRLIVIDNGSTDGSREWILEQHKKGIIWKYIFTKENLMMGKAFVEGLKQVESELFITTQDDIPPPYPREEMPCWLSQMIKFLNDYSQYVSISLDYVNGSFFKYLARKYGREQYLKIIKKNG